MLSHLILCCTYILNYFNLRMLRWQNRNFESKRWSWQLTMGHLFGRFPSGASVARKHRTTKWQVCTPQSSTPARTVTRCVLGCTLTEMAWERTHTCPSSSLLWEVSHQLLFLQKIHKQENVHPADMHDEAGIVQLGVYVFCQLDFWWMHYK